jgi:hypothetical protein
MPVKWRSTSARSPRICACSRRIPRSLGRRSDAEAARLA